MVLSAYDPSMGDRESPPYTAPMCSGPKISEHAEGKKAQCAPRTRAVFWFTHAFARLEA